MDGVPINFVGKIARMKEGYRERDRKKSTEARADTGQAGIELDDAFKG